MAACNFGYDYNDGGINNQKLALIGLVSHVAELDDAQARKLYLPLIYNKDQHDKVSSLELFEDVFWFDVFQDFLQRWEIELVERPSEFSSDRIIAKGWNYFGLGAGKLAQLGDGPLNKVNMSLVSDLLRSLIPRIKSSIEFQTIADLVFRENMIDDVVQFRIEEDWLHHTADWEKRHGYPEDVYISAEEIVNKISKTLKYPSKTKIFATCDERYIFKPKWEIREAVISATGVNVIFKSDLIDSRAYQSIKPVHASLIDFEIVKMARNFIGNSRSTFSNIASFERCIGTYRPQGYDYIYNHIGDEIKMRKDMGTRDHPVNVTQSAKN